VNEIIAAVCEPIHIDGNEIRVGGTIGIAMSDDKVQDVGDLIRNSDLALYFCKTTGRGRACFYNRDMYKDADQQRVLREDLRKAISEEQLRLELPARYRCRRKPRRRV
jgi:predicted signal transduction protein with EAL and GGDEF domain